MFQSFKSIKGGTIQQDRNRVQNYYFFLIYAKKKVEFLNGRLNCYIRSKYFFAKEQMGFIV